jgi:hypothetical protein
MYGMFCVSSPTILLMMITVVISEMLVSFYHLLRLMAQNEFFLNLVAVKSFWILLLAFAV